MSEEKKPIDLGSLDLGIEKQPAKPKRKPAYKETGHKEHLTAARKAKTKGEHKAREAKKVQSVQNKMNKTPGTGEGDGEPLKHLAESPNVLISDKDAAIRRLQEIAASSHEQSAIRACKELIDHFDNQQDPTDRIDPAAVCSYISRAQLYGEDPAKVLLQQHGLYKVAKALALSLGLDQVKLVLGDETGDYSNLAQ